MMKALRRWLWDDYHPCFEMRILVTEACLVILGVLGITFGFLYMQHTLDKARDAKLYDQTHRCVASAAHEWFMWSAPNSSDSVRICAGTACATQTIDDHDAHMATLVLVVLNATGADADSCAGIVPGLQVSVAGHGVSRTEIERVFAGAMGHRGEYRVRYSPRQDAVFAYNVTAVHASVNNTLRPSLIKNDREYWMQRLPLGAVLILVSTAMMACGIVVDRKRGEGVRFEIEQEEQELRPLWARGSESINT